MPEDVEMKNPQDWVKITSDDGFTFLVRRNVVLTSGTLQRAMSVDAGFTESSSGTIEILERGAIVEKLCEYMAFKAQYENVPRGGKDEIPVHEMLERIQPEIALELLLAADYHEL